MTASPLRLGVFGGAFDPPHLAHLALAQAAIEQLKLDCLHVVPTGQAWHKPQTLSPTEHRLAMAQAAFEHLPHAVIDPRELRRSGPSYTVDTLRELKAEQPLAELFLIVGEDQAATFSSWHQWQEIARLATVCVAARSLPQKPSVQQLNLPPAVPWCWLQLPPMHESATEIRARAAAGASIAHLVCPAVARYIDQHCLY